MKVTDYQPSSSLRGFVLGYKLIESDAAVVNYLLPDTSLALAFRLEGNVNQRLDKKAISLAPITLSGLRNNMREIEYERHAKTLVALLSPAGAAHFFDEPLHHFYNLTVSLEECAKVNFTQLQDQIFSCNDIKNQVAVVDRFFLAKVKSKRIDPVVQQAMRRIAETQGLIRVKDLCLELCLSQDAFEKRFRRQVGATPKQYATIVRMRSVLQHKATDLAQVAYDHEFYDASHFNKSFKQFTGKNPVEFFRKPSFW